MANRRKAFNFRSGLQVDNDNFVVNANGLVGIGTSIPQNYFLNVYGDKGLRVTGLTTTQDLNVSRNVEISGITTVGVLTASSIDIANGVNVGGALTAATLKLANGDTVDNLIGFARTTFITDNGGVGLHTTSKIGINTTTSPGASDPELSVIGNVDVTGVITATTFSGDVTGDVTGNINAISGVSTFTELKVGTAITMSAGIITATSFNGELDSTDLTGTIVDARLPDLITSNINASSGVSTFTELKVGTAITMSAGIITATSFNGNLTGTATTATNLADGANITTGTINDARLPDVITSNINILSGTSYFNQIGVNTTTPSSDIHVIKNIQTALQVTSNSNASLIGLGRSENITGYNGVLRYGNTDPAFSQFSGVGVTSYSLDVMNYGPGNLNFYLNPSNIAGTTGGFFWHKETQRLMALTSAGNLGVGLTNPAYKLEVNGTAYVSGNVEFANNLNLTNNLILGLNGSIGINSTTPTQKLDVVGNIAATGSIVAGSISTINGTSSQFLKADGSIDDTTYLTSTTLNIVNDNTPQLGGDLNLNTNDITGTGNLNVIGIITTNTRLQVGLGVSINTSVVSATGGFTSGIGVTTPVQISVTGSTLTFNVVGVGSTSLTLS